MAKSRPISAEEKMFKTYSKNQNKQISFYKEKLSTLSDIINEANSDSAGHFGGIRYDLVEQMVDQYAFLKEKEDELKAQDEGLVKKLNELDSQIITLRDRDEKILTDIGIDTNPLYVLEKLYLWGPPLTNENVDELKNIAKDLGVTNHIVKNKYSVEETTKQNTHYHKIFGK